MRIWLIIILFITLIFDGLSQDILNLKIIDSSTKDALAYCNISFIGTTEGRISNSEGVFIIKNNEGYDSIRISYIGYKPAMLAVDNINDGDIIKLYKTNFTLTELTIHADNEYLYDLINKIRKKLLKNKIPYSAKVYYGIESQTKEIPLELLECFYNGEISGEHINSLTYKNGRVGLASVDGNYFENFNTAKAISKINILHKSSIYPILPFQLGKRKLKKYYKLVAYTTKDNIIKIDFTPYNSKEYFSGTMWINPKENTLLKLELNAKKTIKHPFLPMHSFDKISNVSLKIIKYYKTEGHQSLIDHIYFEYGLAYKSVRSKNDSSQRIIERNISSKGIIRIYDYNNTFIIPYFDYPPNLYYGDYYKMSFIPYNALFWKSNQSIALSNEQKQKLDFFSSKGKLVNYRDGNYGDNFIKRIRNNSTKETGHFEFYYSFWNKDKRIAIKKDIKQNKPYNSKNEGPIIKRDLYNIEAQLLLDITRINDSLDFKSYSVFDSYKTFYRLPIDSITNALINIYLDIYEIKRTKMQTELEATKWTLQQADSIYQQSNTDIKELTKKYIEEVQMGKNTVEFEKWNKYVLDNLGIDNLKLINYYNKN